MPKSQVLVGMTDTAKTSYTLLLTTEPDPLRAAQRLRHQVFHEDGSAVLSSPVPGRDVERVDAFCDHLIVLDGSGTVVGTCRLLPPERVHAAGAHYSDADLDLTALGSLRPQLVEAGRLCVHRDHRTGGVIGLMLAGLARYLLLTRNRWLGGCVNVPLDDGGALAAGVWPRVRTQHLAPGKHRVTPRRP